jgi:mRNA-degrading endonuclease toxin of MazEF toxin-antitoxin module
VKAWEVWKCDLGHGPHPVVIVSHPLRAANKPIVEVIDCSTQRAARPPDRHEVLLDTADGMDWETLCKCDCIYAVKKTDLSNCRGLVTVDRRRQIIRAILRAHDWDNL